MKRTNPIEDAAGKTPSVVLRAFAPETEYVLSLDGYLLLEAIGSPLTKGQVPGLRDIMIALLVMTDTDAVTKARRTGKLDSYISAASAGKKPGDILALAEKVKAAFEEALAPTEDGVTHEKKPSTASAGG